MVAAGPAKETDVGAIAAKELGKRAWKARGRSGTHDGNGRGSNSGERVEEAGLGGVRSQRRRRHGRAQEPERRGQAERKRPGREGGADQGKVGRETRMGRRRLEGVAAQARGGFSRGKGADERRRMAAMIERLEAIVREADEDAFLFISDAHEVLGEGFRRLME